MFDRLAVVQVLLWDTAASNSPVQAVEKAHGSCDVHTVDWSGLQEHLIVTGDQQAQDHMQYSCGPVYSVLFILFIQR
jgi:hypothetical protein